MSRPGTNELRPGWGDPRLNHGATNKEARNSQGNGPQLTKKEIAEVQRQSEEVAREVKKLGRAMVIISVTIVACTLGLYAWGS